MPHKTTAFFNRNCHDYGAQDEALRQRGDYDYDSVEPYYDELSGKTYKYGVVNTTGADNYRLGALYFGYKNYRAGVNSEKIRHTIQNGFAHQVLTKQASFRATSWDWKPYYQYQSHNPYTLW